MTEEAPHDYPLYADRTALNNGARETEVAFFLRVWRDPIFEGHITLAQFRRADIYLYSRLASLKSKKNGPSMLRALTPPHMQGRQPSTCADEKLAKKRLRIREQVRRWRANPANRAKERAARKPDALAGPPSRRGRPRKPRILAAE